MNTTDTNLFTLFKNNKNNFDPWVGPIATITLLCIICATTTALLVCCYKYPRLKNWWEELDENEENEENENKNPTPDSNQTNISINSELKNVNDNNNDENTNERRYLIPKKQNENNGSRRPFCGIG